MTLIVIIFYLIIWAFGLYLVWRAYQLGIKKNLKYAKSWNRVLYKHHKFIQKLAITDLVTGCAIILFAITIPLLQIKFHAWPLFIGGLGLIRQSMLLIFTSKNDA
jgi:hypothetical protein